MYVCLCVERVLCVMTNIHQLKCNCRINGANFDVQNGFTTQLHVCDWFAFDGPWLMSKYNFVCVHNCVYTTLLATILTHLFSFDSLQFYFSLLSVCPFLSDFFFYLHLSIYLLFHPSRFQCGFNRTVGSLLMEQTRAKEHLFCK